MVQSLHAKQPSLSQGDLALLRDLFRAESQNLWAIGDELLRLKQLGHKLKDIAKHFGRRKNRLSEILQTAKAFPAHKRDPDVPFFRHELARLVFRRSNFDSDLMSALRLIERRKFTRRRQVYAAFAREADQRASRHSCPTPILTDHGEGDGLVNRCHHRDYRNLLDRFAEGSIKVIHADPPYGLGS
jgi:hypothetical protein